MTDRPISKVSLRNGTLTISGKGAGLYALENAPQGEIALRLQLGTLTPWMNPSINGLRYSVQFDVHLGSKRCNHG